MKSAVEARRVVQERFTAGVATNTDLLDAQQDQLEAELQRTRALANVRLAEARLARALGNDVLPELKLGPTAQGSDVVGPSFSLGIVEAESTCHPRSASRISRAGSASSSPSTTSASTCAEGEIFGFLGANGAGKSTTIRMLCGLLRRRSGTAIVGGVDVSRDPEAVKLRIGYMSQKFSLYEALTVDQNIRFFGGVYGLEGEAFEERRRFALEMAGLVGRETAMTRDLAGGWRQRLALGCAILHEPPIVFLDEPTGGVDPVSRRQFWRLIDRLSQEGTTVLVTTHYLDEAEHCHRIAVMSAGQARRAGHDRRAEAGVRPAGRSSRCRRTTPWPRCASSNRCPKSRRPACSARPSTPSCATSG